MITTLLMLTLASGGYHPGFACRPAVQRADAGPVSSIQNVCPTVRCVSGQLAPMLGETIVLRADASDPNNDRLHFMWSPSVGMVNGDGPQVSYLAASPVPVTITVRVTDERGCSAEDSCEVQAQAPLQRVEPLRCVPGGFPRNLARLNNVDKACLDDIATRLRQDPRSTVTVTGHADSGEQDAVTLGTLRAREVQKYLVERGIEETRIKVSSAGGAEPLNTGTDLVSRARNRRVEIIFVPAQ